MGKLQTKDVPIVCELAAQFKIDNPVTFYDAWMSASRLEIIKNRNGDEPVKLGSITNELIGFALEIYIYGKKDIK